MRKRQSNGWREYDLDQRVTVTVTMTIEAGVLRVRQQKNNGFTCYANLKHGLFLSETVLDALVRDGLLVPRVKHGRRRQQDGCVQQRGLGGYEGSTREVSGPNKKARDRTWPQGGDEPFQQSAPPIM